MGVLKALFEGASPSTGYQPLDAALYSGSSIGSYNAAFMVSHSAKHGALEAAIQLERVWRERIAAQNQSCTNGIFRLRGSPEILFNPRCWSPENARDLTHDAGYIAGVLAAESVQFLTSKQDLALRILNSIDLTTLFEPEPFYKLVAETLDPVGMLTSSTQLKITATSFESGRPRVFDKREVAKDIGVRAVCASAAIPGVLPTIDINGEPFTDGSVTQNTPLVPAIIAGTTEAHAVFLSPRIKDIPLPILPNTFDTLYRLLLITSSNQFHATAVWLTHLKHLHASGYSIAEIQQLSGLQQRYLRPILRRGDLSSLVIHKYVPDIDLDGADGLLDFSKTNIERNLRLGYRDAVRHDCDRAGCMFAASQRKNSNS